MIKSHFIDSSMYELFDGQLVDFNNIIALSLCEHTRMPSGIKFTIWIGDKEGVIMQTELKAEWNIHAAKIAYGEERPLILKQVDFSEEEKDRFMYYRPENYDKIYKEVTESYKDKDGNIVFNDKKVDADEIKETILSLTNKPLESLISEDIYLTLLGREYKQLRTDFIKWRKENR